MSVELRIFCDYCDAEINKNSKRDPYHIIRIQKVDPDSNYEAYDRRLHVCDACICELTPEGRWS